MALRVLFSEYYSTIVLFLFASSNHLTASGSLRGTGSDSEWRKRNCLNVKRFVGHVLLVNAMTRTSGSRRASWFCLSIMCREPLGRQDLRGTGFDCHAS